MPLAAAIDSAGILAVAGAAATSAPTILIADSLSRCATWLALGLGLLLAATAVDRRSSRARYRFGVLLLSVAGVVLAAHANDLIVVVAATELASLAAALLIFIEEEQSTPGSRPLSPWAFHLFALLLLVAGAALVGFAAGTTNLERLQTALPQLGTSRHLRAAKGAYPFEAQIGCVLLMAGLGIHFLAAPFQLAAAEIFDGARWWGIALVSLFPRQAALLAMIRVLVDGLPRLHGTVQTLFTAVALITVVIGGLLALSQTRLRRLLAYLVVLNNGLLLAGLAAGCAEAARPVSTPWLDERTPGGVGAACLCFACDSLALVGLLAILGARERSTNRIDEAVQLGDALRGRRVLAIAASLLFLGLAGTPPFAGFWPRLAVLRSVLSISIPSEHGFLPHQSVAYVVVALAVTTGGIVATAVCLRIGKRLFLDEDDVARVDVVLDTAESHGSGSTRMAVSVGLVAAGGLVVLAFFPGVMMRTAAHATSARIGARAARTAEDGPPPVRRRHAADADEDSSAS